MARELFSQQGGTLFFNWVAAGVPYEDEDGNTVETNVFHERQSLLDAEGNGALGKVGRLGVSSMLC